MGWGSLGEVGVEVSVDGAGVWAGFFVFLCCLMFRGGVWRFFVWWLVSCVIGGSKGGDGRF